MPIDTIEAIVYARIGDEFVLHCPGDFDYRFKHADKDWIIMCILHALACQGVESLMFYFNAIVLILCMNSCSI